MHSGIPGCLKFTLGPVPNGTLHVHLRSYGLIMAAACSCQCPLSPRDRRVSHSSFLRSEGSSQAAIMRPRSALLPSPQQTSTRQSKRHYVTKVQTQRKTARVKGAIWDGARVHSRLLPDSQSGITSRKCRLRGRPQGFRVPFGTGP